MPATPRALLSLALLGPVLVPLPDPAVSSATGTADGFADRVAPVLEAYCVACHEPSDPAGDLDLTPFTRDADALAAPDTWRAVADVLRHGEMPPETEEVRPTPQEVDGVLEWIESALGVAAAPDSAPAPTGRTTARRLNRYEFENAVLDLFGVHFPARDHFPADGVGRGFDVLGDVLSASPLLVEKTFEAAERVAAEAVPAAEMFAERRFPAAELELEGGARLSGETVAMYSNATAVKRVRVLRSGEYVLRVRAAAQQAGPDLARLAFTVDGREIARQDVTAELDATERHEARVRLEAGERRIGASFVNDYFEPEHPDPAQRDRNLYVADLSLAGPTDAPLRTAFQARYVRAGELDDGSRGLRRVLDRVTRLAWRGPVSRNQVSELMQLAPRDAEPDERLRAALTAVIVSPRFLYRVEPDRRDPTRPLEGRELATRLAAFLWSSVPDAALLDAARAGRLDDTAGLLAETDRMLADARASRLAVAFAGQWLQLRRLDDAAPDPRRFPGWDAALRDSMRRETEAFFEAVLRERRPIRELLVADFTFVDERLARHYGIAGVEGDALRRVSIPAHLADARGGLLGQAAPLTATSMPTRTSPVVRGKWVLEALLATPPPPPPPGVDSIDEEEASVGGAATVREQLEAHRSKRACAACHEPMDGLGFALENFGPTGAWRESDAGAPIDTRAELPGGVRFEGPGGLRARLLEDGRFTRGLARHLATFALGRGPTAGDQRRVDALAAALPEHATLHDLIRALVADELFRVHRRGESE